MQLYQQRFVQVEKAGGSACAQLRKARQAHMYLTSQCDLTLVVEQLP